MPAHLITEKNPAEIKGAVAPYPVFFTWCSPNGYKLSIFAELLGIDYYVYRVMLPKKEQKEEWYLKFNPNGKIPALANVTADGKVQRINESAAILLFLADKYDTERKYSFEPGTKEYYELLEWVFFQMSGLAPIKGQLHFFGLFSEKKDEFAIDRFYSETLRLFGVLDEQLKRNGTGFLVSDHLTIADINTYPWFGRMNIGNLEKDIEKFPHLVAWLKKLGKIPEVKTGMEIPQRP